MPRAPHTHYLKLSDADALAVITQLNAGRPGVDIAREMQCSPSLVSQIKNALAFRHLGGAAKQMPKFSKLGFAAHKQILGPILRERYLHGLVPAQVTCQRAAGLQGKGKQPSVRRRMRTLEAMRTVNAFVARVLAYVGPTDPVTGCRRWGGPMRTQAGKVSPLAYLVGAPIDPVRSVLLPLAGRRPVGRERATFTCANTDGRCCSVDHIAKFRSDNATA